MTEKSATDELKPCPFCGGEAEIVTLDIWDKNAPVGVGCSMCPVILAEYSDYKRFATEADAIEAWNTRAELGGTCKMAKRMFLPMWTCSACGVSNGGILGVSEYEPPNSCPSCGRKVER